MAWIDKPAPTATGPVCSRAGSRPTLEAGPRSKAEEGNPAVKTATVFLLVAVLALSQTAAPQPDAIQVAFGQEPISVYHPVFLASGRVMIPATTFMHCGAVVSFNPIEERIEISNWNADLTLFVSPNSHGIRVL